MYSRYSSCGTAPETQPAYSSAERWIDSGRRPRETISETQKWPPDHPVHFGERACFVGHEVQHAVADDDVNGVGRYGKVFNFALQELDVIVAEPVEIRAGAL